MLVIAYVFIRKRHHQVPEKILVLCNRAIWRHACYDVHQEEGPSQVTTNPVSRQTPPTPIA